MTFRSGGETRRSSTRGGDLASYPAVEKTEALSNVKKNVRRVAEEREATEEIAKGTGKKKWG